MILYSIILILIIGIIFQHFRNEKRFNKLCLEFDNRISLARKESVQKSKDVTRGQIAQEFIPLFPDFPYNLSDCKFSGMPLDFIVYKGMSDLRDGVDSEIEIIFADVKVNQAKRNKIQNAIREAINKNKVKFETWNIDNNKNIIIK